VKDYGEATLAQNKNFDPMVIGHEITTRRACSRRHLNVDEHVEQCRAVAGVLHFLTRFVLVLQMQYLRVSTRIGRKCRVHARFTTTARHAAAR
jgi:hypothetical protein